ncbi:MAG: hypothetical protein ACLP2X_20285 [Syntrophobacteraceae bacterium]
MISNSTAWNIVAVGFWNRMIFDPKWVGENAFHAPEIELLVSTNPFDPIVYQNAEISLRVSEQLLIVNARKPTRECLIIQASMARDILSNLPKTPISAIGVNFGFIQRDLEQELLEYFGFKDDVELGSKDWNINKKSLVRTLSQENTTLNLTLTLGPPEVLQPEPKVELQISANFHYNVSSAAEALEKIEQESVVSVYDKLIHLLSEVYKLNLDMETSNV